MYTFIDDESTEFVSDLLARGVRKGRIKRAFREYCKKRWPERDEPGKSCCEDVIAAAREYLLHEASRIKGDIEAFLVSGNLSILSKKDTSDRNRLLALQAIQNIYRVGSVSDGMVALAEVRKYVEALNDLYAEILQKYVPAAQRAEMAAELRDRAGVMVLADNGSRDMVVVTPQQSGTNGSNGTH